MFSRQLNLKRRQPRRCTPRLEGLEDRQLLSSIPGTKVVDASTPLPEKDTGNFTRLCSPTIDGTDVAFLNYDSSYHNSGIYLASAGNAPQTIANTTAALPDGGHFTSVGAPSLSHGVVAFMGYEKTASGATLGGIFTNLGGTVHAVVTTNTAAPNGTGNFANFAQPPSISGNNIVFMAGSHDYSGWHYGVYLYDGTLHTIADATMSVPSGSGKFASFNQAIVDASGDVAFLGSNSAVMENQGVYLYSQGHLKAMANTSTAIPGGAGTFQSFQYLAFADGVLAVSTGLPSGGSGIYRYDNTAWQVVADTKTAVPSGTGTFTGLCSPPAIDQGNVVFYAASSGGVTGVYSKLGDNPPVKVIRSGDSLDGKTVQSFTTQFSPVVRGQSIVVSVSLSGSSYPAIYRVDVSPPVQVTTAKFVTNPLSVADHTVEDEGTAFPQTFTLHNSGTTTWTNLQLVHVSDSDLLGATDPIPVPTTLPGQTAVVTVQLQATKSDSGSGATQLAYWELKDGETVVPISGTTYDHSEASYAANKVWTMITIQPPPDSGSYIPDLRSPGYTSANPYAVKGLGGQCTAFVWGRVYEVMGVKLLFTADAGNGWISGTEAMDYKPPVQTPRANSIAVWAKYDANGNEIGGHVAYVESVDGNNVVINEANWGDSSGSCYNSYASLKDPMGPHTWAGGYGGYSDGQPNNSLTVSAMQSRGSYTLLGYIYL